MAFTRCCQTGRSPAGRVALLHQSQRLGRQAGRLESNKTPGPTYVAGRGVAAGDEVEAWARGPAAAHGGGALPDDLCVVAGGLGEVHARSVQAPLQAASGRASGAQKSAARQAARQAQGCGAPVGLQSHLGDKEVHAGGAGVERAARSEVLACKRVSKLSLARPGSVSGFPSSGAVKEHSHRTARRGCCGQRRSRWTRTGRRRRGRGPR